MYTRGYHLLALRTVITLAVLIGASSACASDATSSPSANSVVSTLATHPTESTTTAPAATTASTTVSPTPGVPTWTGPFQQRWSAPIASPLLVFENAPDRVYVVTNDGPTLIVTAFAPSDGTRLWDVTLSETASIADNSVSVNETPRGLMIMYDDEAGRHLALLNSETGAPDWNTVIGRQDRSLQPAITSNIGILENHEINFGAGIELVDLNTGERVVDESDSRAVNRAGLVTVTGNVMRIGLDPFNATSNSPEVVLPVASVASIGADPDGDLIAVASDDMIIGFVADHEHWRWEPNIGALSNVQVSGSHVFAVGENDPARIAVARIAGDNVVPLGELPTGFVVQDIAQDGDRTFLLGTIHESGAGNNEVTLSIVQVGEELTVRRAQDAVADRGSRFAGAFAIHQTAPDAIDVYDRDLNVVTQVPHGERDSLESEHGRLVRYDAAADSIVVYG